MKPIDNSSGKPGSPALAAAGGGGLLIFLSQSLGDASTFGKILAYSAPAISVYGAILTKWVIRDVVRRIELYKKREFLKLTRKACDDADKDPLLPPETKEKIKKKYAEVAEAAFDDHMGTAGQVFPKP